MFCSNCGRPLKDGEVCSCMNSENNVNNGNNGDNENNTSYYESLQQQFYTEQQYHYTPSSSFDPSKYPEGYIPKNRYVAAILALFVGSLGIHNFYLGNRDKAIAQLLLSTVGILVIVGPIISSVWALIDLVNILTKVKTDANGYNLKDTFN